MVPTEKTDTTAVTGNVFMSHQNVVVKVYCPTAGNCQLGTESYFMIPTEGTDTPAVSSQPRERNHGNVYGIFHKGFRDLVRLPLSNTTRERNHGNV